MDEKVILRHAEYVKSHYFYCLTEDHIQRVRFKVKS